MANAIIEALLGVSGLSLTVDLYPFGSDTVAVAGIALAEAANRKGLYTGTTAAGLTGLHQAFVKTGSTVLGVFDVSMTDDTSVHRLVDQAGSLLVQDKTGYALSPAGLDAISTAAPAGVATNFREMLVQLWRRFFRKSTLTGTQLKTYADDGATVLTTQPVSDDGTTQTQGSVT